MASDHNPKYRQSGEHFSFIKVEDFGDELKWKYLNDRRPNCWNRFGYNKFKPISSWQVHKPGVYACLQLNDGNVHSVLAIEEFEPGNKRAEIDASNLNFQTDREMQDLVELGWTAEEDPVFFARKVCLFGSRQDQLEQLAELRKETVGLSLTVPAGQSAIERRLVQALLIVARCLGERPHP